MRKPVLEPSSFLFFEKKMSLWKICHFSDFQKMWLEFCFTSFSLKLMSRGPGTRLKLIFSSSQCDSSYFQLKSSHLNHIHHHFHFFPRARPVSKIWRQITKMQLYDFDGDDDDDDDNDDDDDDDIFKC